MYVNFRNSPYFFANTSNVFPQNANTKLITIDRDIAINKGEELRLSSMSTMYIKDDVKGKIMNTVGVL